MTNVQPFQAGQYSVQVTNAAGALISFPATLQVSGLATVPLVTPLLSAALLGQDVQLSFNANIGRIYSWLVSTNPSAWTIATSFVSASTRPLWLVSPAALVPERYFKVSSP